MQAIRAAKAEQEASHLDDYDDDFNEVVEAESEDDDTVFKSRASLPPSAVQCWKLSELIGKCPNDVKPNISCSMLQLREDPFMIPDLHGSSNLHTLRPRNFHGKILTLP